MIFSAFTFSEALSFFLWGYFQLLFLSDFRLLLLIIWWSDIFFSWVTFAFSFYLILVDYYLFVAAEAQRFFVRGFSAFIFYFIFVIYYFNCIAHLPVVDLRLTSKSILTSLCFWRWTLSRTFFYDGLSDHLWYFCLLFWCCLRPIRCLVSFLSTFMISSKVSLHFTLLSLLLIRTWIEVFDFLVRKSVVLCSISLL